MDLIAVTNIHSTNVPQQLASTSIVRMLLPNSGAVAIASPNSCSPCAPSARPLPLVPVLHIDNAIDSCSSAPGWVYSSRTWVSPACGRKRSVVPEGCDGEGCDGEGVISYREHACDGTSDCEASVTVLAQALVCGHCVLWHSAARQRPQSQHSGLARGYWTSPSSTTVQSDQ